MKASRALPRAVLAISASLLVACLNPIDRSLLLHRKDAVSPQVAISSPVEGASYAAAIVVTGAVSDSSSTAGDGGQVASLRYTVTPATIPSADVTSSLDSDGTYSFQFVTTGFTGTMLITVSATDWNGNVGSASVTLADEGAIPSFAAAPGSGAVTLSWDPVPLSTGYTLFYTTNGSVPSAANGLQVSGVSSPLALTGLANGAMHVFRLESTSSSGADNWSPIVKAIPLSKETVAPRASGGFGRIRVEWPPIPATGEFEVLRSTSPSAGFVNVSGAVTATSFTDTGVAPGQMYYYQVRPSLAGSLESGAVSAMSSAFPTGLEMRVGYAIPPGQLMDVAVQAGYAYGSNYTYGLQVFDIGDPRRPVLVGGLNVGQSMGLAVQGTYAYVGGDGPSLRVIDISNPASPVQVGAAIPVPARVNDAAISGSQLFLACEGGGVVRYDLSTPAAPVVVGAPYTATGGAYGIAALGSYVYVAYESALRILNAGAMPNLTLAGSFVTNRAMDVAAAVSGPNTYAYVADEQAPGLRVINVTLPATPSQAGFIAVTGMQPRAVALRGSFALTAGYISVGGAALQVVNVADPASPKIATAAALPSHAEAVAASGDYAFVVDMGQLQVVNVSNPAAPAAGGAGTIGGAYDLALDGDRAVVTGLSSAKLQLFDITSPGSPAPLGSFTAASNPYGVAVVGTRAYLSEFNRFEIVDISNPLAPALLGSSTLTGYGSDIALRGDYAFVADGPTGMQVIDVSDPGQPSIVGSYLTSSGTGSIAVQGAYAYLARSSAPYVFEIVDISNPLIPVLAGSWTSANPVYDLAVSGSFAYLATTGTRGLQIVDISDAGNPSPTNSVNLGFNGRSVEVVGDFALVGDLDVAKVQILNVRDPVNPRIIGAAAVPDTAVAVKVRGSSAFIADWTSGFRTVTLW
jgi:hypothetical protein